MKGIPKNWNSFEKSQVNILTNTWHATLHYMNGQCMNTEKMPQYKFKMPQGANTDTHRPNTQSKF